VAACVAALNGWVVGMVRGEFNSHQVHPAWVEEYAVETTQCNLFT